jgi:hypothetical protein
VGVEWRNVPGAFRREGRKRGAIIPQKRRNGEVATGLRAVCAFDVI